MEKFLAFCAILCALMFGLGLELIKKKKNSKKPWNVAFKLLIQGLGIASYLCTFFSLRSEQMLLRHDTAVLIAIISIPPIFIFASLGNLLPDAYEEVKHIIKYGIKRADKSFLWMCFTAAMVILTGNIAVHYLFSQIPIMLHSAIVVIMGGLICMIAGCVLLISYGFLRLILHLLKNAKKLGNTYWKWLTN